MIIEILSLFATLTNKISDEFKTVNKNENLYFIFQNYIKFLNKLVFSKIFQDFSILDAKIFIEIFSEIVNLFNKEYILNTNVLVQIKIEEKYYKKTFLEIMIDIFMSILFNNKFYRFNKRKNNIN